MAVYGGEAFPEWRGDLFLGALAHRHLRRLELEGNEVVGQEELLAGIGERIRDVRSGPDGFLYVLTDSDDGRLLRLEPAEQDFATAELRPMARSFYGENKRVRRSEEHTSELQSLMRISYAVFSLKKKNKQYKK